MDYNFIKNVEKKLAGPLPGKDAQRKMSNAFRPVDTIIPDNVRQAGVLALFYPKAEDWHLVFIERTSKNKNDRHRGQISFPGGKFEENDGVLSQTAIREAEEEIGVKSNDIHLLGELTQLHVPVSNFLVSPFVGFLEYTPNFTPQETEVSEVLEVPFQRFSEKGVLKQKDLKISEGFVIPKVQYFDIHDKVLWGATAMMMSELLEVLEVHPLSAISK